MNNYEKYKLAFEESKKLYNESKDMQTFVNEVKAITDKYLDDNQIKDFLLDLFNELGIDIIPKINLSTGYEVYLEEDEHSFMDHLVNSINGEMMVNKPKEYFSENVCEILSKEITYILQNTNENIKEGLLEYLLLEKTFSTRNEVIMKAYPELFNENIIEKNNINDMFRYCKENVVLIIGKDTGKELGYLKNIKNILKENGLEGVLLKEEKDIIGSSVTDKFRKYSTICSFVIAEDSVLSGHLIELEICKSNDIVTAILRREGSGSSEMAKCYSQNNKNMKYFKYEIEGKNDLKKILEKVIAWGKKQSSK